MSSFFTLEITFVHPETGEVATHRLKNFTGAELKIFRENIWFAGFFLPVNSSRNEGYLVGPSEIKWVYMVKQDKFHKTE